MSQQEKGKEEMYPLLNGCVGQVSGEANLRVQEALLSAHRAISEAITLSALSLSLSRRLVYLKTCRGAMSDRTDPFPPGAHARLYTVPHEQSVGSSQNSFQSNSLPL